MECRTIKYSRQREAIWDYVKDRKDHPTADMVYNYVKKTFPNISLATVYRNLMLLKDMEKLRVVIVGDGMVHFDPDMSEHDHFICTQCGKVTDIKFEEHKSAGVLPINFGGRIDGSFTVYHGLCEQCLKKNKNI